jgi:hypothetical protein
MLVTELKDVVYVVLLHPPSGSLIVLVILKAKDANGLIVVPFIGVAKKNLNVT